MELTLEQAQERIVELTEQVTTLQTERDSLLQDNETLRTESENLRTLNQKFFNKLIAQDDTKNDDVEEGEEVPTCEEFAETLNI